MNILNGETYDDQSEAYAGFAKDSFSWKYIERPGIDDYLGDHYERATEMQVLDIGCGSGRVIEHLIERGVPPQNITGLDPSQKMLEIAAGNLPHNVGLVREKASNMPFNAESFQLVISTMVMHAMDGREASKTVGRVGEVLAPGGDFFFIDTNPYIEANDGFLNRWVSRRSPWGTKLSVFNHDVDKLLDKVASDHGLERVRGGPLPVDEAGQVEDPEEYERYSGEQFRIAALLRKTES